jgi:hypothetical protein
VRALVKLRVIVLVRGMKLKCIYGDHDGEDGRLDCEEVGERVRPEAGLLRLACGGSTEAWRD